MAWLPVAIMQDWGIQVRSAQNYEEAVRACHEEHFGAFIVDVRLVEHDQQNRDGLKFVHKMIADQPAAPVLILSGWMHELEEARKDFDAYSHIQVIDKEAFSEIKTAINQLCRRMGKHIAT